MNDQCTPVTPYVLNPSAVGPTLSPALSPVQSAMIQDFSDHLLRFWRQFHQIWTDIGDFCEDSSRDSECACTERFTDRNRWNMRRHLFLEVRNSRNVYPECYIRRIQMGYLSMWRGKWRRMFHRFAIGWIVVQAHSDRVRNLSQKFAISVRFDENCLQNLRRWSEKSWSHRDCTGDNAGDSVGPTADGFETYGVTGVALISFIVLAMGIEFQATLNSMDFRHENLMIFSNLFVPTHQRYSQLRYRFKKSFNFEAPLTRLIRLSSSSLSSSRSSWVISW